MRKEEATHNYGIQERERKEGPAKEGVKRERRLRKRKKMDF